MKFLCKILNVTLITSTILLTACSSMTPQEKKITGTVGGAVAGGVIGDALLGGPVGTIAGAAAGGVAGNVIGGHYH